jgi:hypothetical protein
MSTCGLSVYSDAPWIVRPEEVEEAARLDAPVPVKRPVIGDQSFFQSKSISELAREQGVGPVNDGSVLAGGFLDDEDIDEMLEETGPVGGRATETLESDSAQLTKAIFEEFVRLVEGIPKVWAVYVRPDSPVVHIWTFVDSSDWRDRSPVYKAEWEMLIHYPETPFDFNVELAPAGSEDFEGENAAFVFKR